MDTSIIQDGFSMETMSWFNEPGKCDTPNDSGPETEGYGGGWEILNDGAEMVLRPDAKRDFWRKTYYTPLLVKTDGPCLLREVQANIELTM